MPLLAIAFFGLLAFAACPFAAAADATRYVVEELSNFQDGCQDGCACPVTVLPLGGAFSLTLTGQDGDFEVFDVSDVSWIILSGVFGDTFVVGSGTFRIRHGLDALQRLELDLTVGDDAPVHFDSGLVPTIATFPDLEVSVAMNAFFCYDNVFSVRARPDEPVPVQSINWGRVKQLYRP